MRRNPNPLLPVDSRFIKGMTDKEGSTRTRIAKSVGTKTAPGKGDGYVVFSGTDVAASPSNVDSSASASSCGSERCIRTSGVLCQAAHPRNAPARLSS